MHAFILSKGEGNFWSDVHGVGLINMRCLLEEAGVLHVRRRLLRRLQLLGLAGEEDFHDARAPIQRTLIPPSVLS